MVGKTQILNLMMYYCLISYQILKAFVGTDKETHKPGLLVIRENEKCGSEEEIASKL